MEKTFSIRKGEKEAISLAIDIGGRKIFCDDKRGINICHLLRIEFTVAIDICISLWKKGVINLSKAKESFELLKRFGWYSEGIIQQREVLLIRWHR